MNDYGISLKRQEHIAIITFERPAKQNALDQHMFDSLDKVVVELKGNLPRVIVLTGAGEKAFCAGFDVNPENPLLKPLSTAMERHDKGPAYDLIHRISAPGKALEEALSLALSITQNGPRSVRHALYVIRKTGDLTTQEALELETEAAATLIASGESIHGISAFLTRQKPEFPEPGES